MSNDRLPESSLLRQDELLLAKYAETGDREAFEQLVRLYEREIYSYLRHCLGDAQLAEDAFQTTFLQLHLKCRQFEPGCRLRPWLYTIANHQAVDLLRRNRRHKAVSLNAARGNTGRDNEGEALGNLLETDDAGPSERLKLTEDRERIRLALEKLPAKFRQLLFLIVYQKLPYREAAEVLGIPLGTVKSRMNKALQHLHEALIAIRHAALSVGQAGVVGEQGEM
jgi:RNA polymerase sigma-70 factor (ECF subfamily)